MAKKQYTKGIIRHAQNYIFRHSERSEESHEIKSKRFFGRSCWFDLNQKSNAIPMNDRKNVAFTLAEVLITLTIIGIIAAITVPNLMQKWQKEATVTKVKKGYNEITRMATNIKTNTNCNDLECTGILDTTFSTEHPEEFLKKFIELADIKNAQVKTTRNWGRITYMYCETQSCDATKGDSFHAYISTQNGMGYYISPYTRNTDNKNFLNITLFTDTKPNNDGYSYFKKGRNSFFFLIADDLHAEPRVFSAPYYLLSESTSNESIQSTINSLCNPQSNTGIYSGSTCAAKIILDGWKMNY